MDSLDLLRDEIKLEDLIFLCEYNRVFFQLPFLNFKEKVHRHKAKNLDVFQDDSVYEVKSYRTSFSVFFDFEHE